MKFFLAVGPSLMFAIVLSSGCATHKSAVQPLTSTPEPPTTVSMRALAERIANGDQTAFHELQETDKMLYRDIDYDQDKKRVMANLILMKAAFDVLGEQAGRGNDRAFQMLKACLGTGHLRSFAPDALGIAAAAGHKEALEILLHHDRWGILLSSTVFALRPVAENNDERVVDFLVGILENPRDRALWYGASEGLAGAAVKGNEKAKAALEKYEAANHQ